MGSSVYSVRLGPEDAERLEALAGKLGLKPAEVLRLGLAEVAVDRPEASEARERYVPPARRQRNAWVCPSCLTRVFLGPGERWDCPDHPGRAVKQENRPYIGKPTS